MMVCTKEKRGYIHQRNKNKINRRELEKLLFSNWGTLYFQLGKMAHEKGDTGNPLTCKFHQVSTLKGKKQDSRVYKRDELDLIIYFFFLQSLIYQCVHCFYVGCVLKGQNHVQSTDDNEARRLDRWDLCHQRAPWQPSVVLVFFPSLYLLRIL